MFREMALEQQYLRFKHLVIKAYNEGARDESSQAETEMRGLY
jgi:hypothetical protein